VYESSGGVTAVSRRHRRRPASVTTQNLIDSHGRNMESEFIQLGIAGRPAMPTSRGEGPRKEAYHRRILNHDRKQGGCSYFDKQKQFSSPPWYQLKLSENPRSSSNCRLEPPMRPSEPPPSTEASGLLLLAFLRTTETSRGIMSSGKSRSSERRSTLRSPKQHELVPPMPKVFGIKEGAGAGSLSRPDDKSVVCLHESLTAVIPPTPPPGQWADIFPNEVLRRVMVLAPLEARVFGASMTMS